MGEHITEPGVYDALDEAVYHAHPALSATGAKRLLPPSCPAIFKWERDHGRPPKKEFDVGSAAHKLVLGVGAEIVVVDAENWRTKAAKAAQKAAHAAGRIPLLAEQYEQVQAMADALRAHPVAAALFDPGRGGKPEQSLFWHDERHGVMRRARFDWLPAASGGRMIVPDYKSARSAEPRAVSNAVADYGYHQQAAWYIDAALALGLAEDVAFVFVFQEKTPPYLVTVAELDAQALQVGRARNDRALEVFVECSAHDTWPGYSDDVELISLPAWATYRHQELIAS